jgi:uncharacterized membrane protein YkvA (DUF1232 family)
MTNSHLLTLMSESKLSPEALGARIGISGMSIRRWLKERENTEIPDPYASAFQLTVQKMIVEGMLPGTSQSALWSFEAIGGLPQTASLHAMGYNAKMAVPLEGEDEKVLAMLSQIGNQVTSEAEVENQTAMISERKKSGREWAKKIGALTSVLKSKKLKRVDKSIAVGALFYLIFAFDLIPDPVPIVGLFDDLAILGVAANYYKNKTSA